MSGRIYDIGSNPICGLCGSTMYTSHQRNFNGAKCKRKGCDGDAIYTEWDFSKNKQEIKTSYDKDGKLILHGDFQSFDKPKMTYTLKERFRNFLYNFKEFFKK